MIRTLTLLFVLSLALPAHAQAQSWPSAPATPVPPAAMTDEQKTVYALGLLMQRSIKEFDLSPDEMQVLVRALVDGAAGKPAIDLNEWGPRVEPLATTRGSRVLARERTAGTAFLDKAAAEAGAVKTDSGLVYRDVTVGTGRSPVASDTVKVHYRGTFVDGSAFDSSYERNEPMTFPLGEVLPCWTEGVPHMKVGGKARLVCPSGLAYGERGAPPTIPSGAVLVFEIELLEIVTAPAAAPAR